MKLVLIAVFLLILNATIAFESNVPVLIYTKLSNQHSIENANIGQSLTPNYFQSLLDKILPKTTLKIAIILLNTLSDQDVRLNVKSNDYLIYRPSVSNAYHTLADYLNSEMIKIDLYQVDTLEEAFELFSKKQQDTSFDGVVLTGYKSSLNEHNLSKRNVFMGRTSNGSYINNTCGISFDAILFGTKKSMQMANVNSIDFSCNVNSTLNLLSIKFDVNKTLADEQLMEMSIVFNKNGSYWYMNSNTSTATTNKGLTYNIRYTGLPDNMETPVKYSFACTQTLFNVGSVNGSFKMIIQKLQVQSYGIQGKLWGQINYCNGFFTAGIWMAITSSLLMLVILAFGINMLTSIQTMSKFDDPKAKPLQIAAEK